jgi:hypothetical protein
MAAGVDLIRQCAEGIVQLPRRRPTAHVAN